MTFREHANGMTGAQLGAALRCTANTAHQIKSGRRRLTRQRLFYFALWCAAERKPLDLLMSLAEEAGRDEVRGVAT